MKFDEIMHRHIEIERHTKDSIRWLSQIIDDGEFRAGHDTLEMLRKLASALQVLELSRDHYEIEQRRKEGKNQRLTDLAYAVPKEDP